jgi:ABC-type transport system involved in multi-copper enzyme maturation permease subunit
VVALSAGADQVRGFAVLTGLSIALGWLMVSTSVMIAVLRPDRLKAMSTALFLWLLLVVAYDLVVLGATTLLGGLPLQRVLVPALLLNPVDIARVLTTLAVGSGALFGPTSAVLMKLSGTNVGIGIGVLVLVVETIVPAAIAMWVFERRDG